MKHKLFPALLKDALRTLVRALRKPATVNYPKVEVEVPEGFRGPPWVDLDKCVGCGLCARDCPAGAIRMVSLGEKRRVPVVDLARCIFCSQCSESCPKGAIRPGREFKIAVSDPGDLVRDFRPLVLGEHEEELGGQ